MPSSLLADCDSQELSRRGLAELLARYATPGASIAAIDRGTIQWSCGSGQCDDASGRPVTERTMFQVGSVSKPVFALAVMRLHDERRLDIDEDVNAYLTSWRVPIIEGWQPRLSLRQLLTHSGGVNLHGFPGYARTDPLPTPIQILNGEAPANTRRVVIDTLPGLGWRYSGGGIQIAQQAVTDQLRMPFAEAMRELVLAPLGMRDSTFVQPLPTALLPGAATGHTWNRQPVSGGFRVHPEMAAAGLWSTAGDLARLGVHLIEVLHGAADSPLVKHETLLAMTSPQLPPANAEAFQGIGWRCSGRDNGFLIEHTGWNEGFVAHVRFYPRARCGSCILLNANQGFPLLFRLVRAMAQAYRWPVLGEPIHDCCDYSGTYRTQLGRSISITRRDEVLFLQFEEQAPVRLTASYGNTFYAAGLELRVSFERPEQRAAPELVLLDEAGETRAARVSVGTEAT